MENSFKPVSYTHLDVYKRQVALITTVGGLIVAMILQVFYNYCIAKIESIVNDMEDASVTLLDILVKYNQKH